MDSTIDHIDTVYSELATTMRHYSTASLNVRILVVAEGVVLLAAWANVLYDGGRWVALPLPLFGLFLTYFLYRFHRGYLDAARFYHKKLVEIEKDMTDLISRPFTVYFRYHRFRYNRRDERWLTLNAPFVLIGICFLAAAALTVLIRYPDPPNESSLLTARRVLDVF